MILKSRAKVERILSPGKSLTGAPLPAVPIDIISFLKCDIQPNKSIVIMPVAGQTIISYMTMFCKFADIKENDIVTDLKTMSKYKVVDVNRLGILPHLEVSMEGGVI